MSVFKQIYENAYKQVECNTRVENKSIFYTLWDILESICVNSFKYTGLPEHIPYRLIEYLFFYSGNVGGFIDEKDGDKPKIFPAFGAGTLRQDGFQTLYQMTAFNGDIWIKDYDDIVLGHNCSSWIPTRFIVGEFVQRMQKCIRAVDNGIDRVAFSQILECDNEQQVNAIIEAYNKQKENMPFIATVGGQMFTNGQIRRTSLFDDREFNISEIWNTFDKYLHTFYTFMGYNNTETEKKERLITDEVNANNQIIQCGFFDDMFNQRKEFISKFNEKFGTNITVEKNRDYLSVAEMLTVPDEMTGGEENAVDNVESIGVQGSGISDRERDSE